MRLKTYRGPSLAALMARIKEELGPEAVILSTGSYKEDGKSVCEITAALEESARKPEPKEAQAAPAKKKRSASNSPQTIPAPTREDRSALKGLERELGGPSASGGHGLPGWGQWHAEWSRIKEELLALSRPAMDYARLTPRQRLALEFLEREAVDEEVLLALYNRLARDPEAAVLDPLVELVPVKPLTRQLYPQPIQGFAGPSGVGKTAVLIRAALERKGRIGTSRKRVLIANADTRAGGRALLKHYAELAGLSYMEVHGPEDAEKLLKHAKKFDTIFLDLPAPARNDTLDRMLDRLGFGDADQRLMALHLVLAPTAGGAQLSASLRALHSPLAASVVWSKLDEAVCYGALVNTAVATGLPVSAFSFGAGLRDTYVPARVTPLFRLVFKHVLPEAQEQERDQAKAPRKARETAAKAARKSARPTRIGTSQRGTGRGVETPDLADSAFEAA